MPHIVDRIAAHTRALSSILHAGLAKHHYAKPSAALQLEKIYGSGILFSGVASLVLSEREISAISRHYRHVICRMQKLPLTTPRCVVFFLAGTLPAVAIIHLRMLSLLGMIARSEATSILQKIGRSSLLNTSNNRNKYSWFFRVRLVAYQYSLPDPLLVLQEPMEKAKWKSLCRSKVISYWEQKLREESDNLTSLKFFSPQYMSLREPHPLWQYPESGYEVSKAATVALMLSDRYSSDYHARHWSRTNPSGFCQLCRASQHSSGTGNVIDPPNLPLGTIEHLLISCPSLSQTREKCRAFWLEYIVDKPVLQDLILFNGSCDPNVQLLLDPSSCPNVIQAVQKTGSGLLGHLLYLSRTWCHSLHVRRRKTLKLLNII